MSLVFASILDTAVLGNIEKPKPMPVGSYQVLIKSLETGKTKSDKKTDYLRIHAETVQPLSDVNEEELAAFGPVNGKKVSFDFYLTEATLWRLNEFIVDHVGLDQLRGVALSQAIPELVNNTVGITVAHRRDERKPDDVYLDVTKTFRIN